MSDWCKGVHNSKTNQVNLCIFKLVNNPVKTFFQTFLNQVEYVLSIEVLPDTSGRRLLLVWNLILPHLSFIDIAQASSLASDQWEDRSPIVWPMRGQDLDWPVRKKGGTGVISDPHGISLENTLWDGMCTAFGVLNAVNLFYK